jgi:hypothetical protein
MDNEFVDSSRCICREFISKYVYLYFPHSVWRQGRNMQCRCGTSDKFFGIQTVNQYDRIPQKKKKGSIQTYTFYTCVCMYVCIYIYIWRFVSVLLFMFFKETRIVEVNTVYDMAHIRVKPCLRSCGLLEKLPIVELLKKFLTFYGIRRFITVFTRSLHWSLSWTRLIQSIPSHSISLRSRSEKTDRNMSCAVLHPFPVIRTSGIMISSDIINLSLSYCTQECNMSFLFPIADLIGNVASNWQRADMLQYLLHIPDNMYGS